MDAETRSFLEEMRREIGGRFDAVDARFDAVDMRFDAVDMRFDAVDMRFDGVDMRFDAVDMRFDGVDQRFEVMDRRFDGSDQRFESMDGRVGGLADEVRRSGVITEGLRSLIQTVAENVALINERLDRFQADVYRDMNAGFSLVHVALGALRRDIDELRQRR